MTFIRKYYVLFGLLSLYCAAAYLIRNTIGPGGFLPNAFTDYTAIKIVFYVVAMAHLTITAMSLSFHRFHTHRGVIFNKYVDNMMQLWLWFVTSMSRLDWVSVHVYHHNTSDTPDDPHSPVHKGFWHVLFLGTFDYTKAKANPEVLKIRKRYTETKMEAFIAKNLFLGPIILTAVNIVLVGPFWGTTLSLINFFISPVFAIGGVNTLAHWWGYRNHKSSDNSRNVGFLFPLNFIICGELDHNNHHGHQKSCSFRHRWFEFDIGYVYIKLLSYMGLARIMTAYTPKTLKADLTRQVLGLLDKDFHVKEKFEKMAQEFNLSAAQMKEEVQAYIQGKKLHFLQQNREKRRAFKLLVDEMIYSIKLNNAYQFSV